MTRKIVAIHGIGNSQPGWSEFLRLELDIPSQDWIEFYYEDLMDRSIFNQAVVWFSRMLVTRIASNEVAGLTAISKDYLNDIVTYFLLSRSRKTIQLRLKYILEAHPDAIILAHSLGSVIAYESLKCFALKAHTLFTLGSPLSKDLVKRLLHVPDFKRPKVTYWFNIWGRFDPIGGRIRGLGCKAKEQSEIPNAHDLLVYVHSQKERILILYGESKELAS